MPFQFVDNSSIINKATRKRIRSHVAIGRNAGKTLTRPSRKDALKLDIIPTAAYTTTPKSVKEAYDLEHSEEIEAGLERQIGDGFAVSSFPVQVTAGSRGLVQRAFSFISGPRHTSKLSDVLNHNTVNSMWVKFMFLDEAYFHCAVALSVIALNNIVVKQEDPKEAMHHLSKAFRLINNRLSNDEAVSDGTIAVVVNLAHHERLQGRHHQGLIHLKGLQRMIELRGGVPQLAKETPGMVQKIFRGDLESSFFLGSATRFTIGTVLSACTCLLDLPRAASRADGRTSSGFRNSMLFSELSLELQSLVKDSTSLAYMINNASIWHRLDGYTFHNTLLVLGYRLIQFSPLGGPRPISHLENAIHLGLTAFLLTFLTGLDRTISRNPLLYQSLVSTVQVGFDEEDESQEVLLWLLFVGRASFFGELENAWLMPRVVQTSHILRLRTWEDVARILGKFPWVNRVHDDAARALWNDITTSYSLSGKSFER